MLKGPNIQLRALEPSDIDLLYEWENNVEVWKISDTIQPFSRYQLQQYVNSNQDVYANRQLRFMIVEKATDTTIGCVDLFDFEPRHGRIGVGILIASPDHRNLGYGKECVRLAVEYAYEMLECHQVYCNILTDNTASIQLFKGEGFTEVGVKRQWIRIGNRLFDEILLQRIKAEE